VSQNETPVIIAGAGWAGLAAAAYLSRYQVPVIVLESAKQIGGRARRVPFNHIEGDANGFSQDPISVDNGQHLLVGAYESTLSLLRSFDVKEAQAFKRVNLSLNLVSPAGKSVSLQTPNLPAPLHLVWGLATAGGLNLKERLSALQFCRRLARQDFTLAEDETCGALFARHRQPPKVITTLWEPLCLGGLNTPIEQASAQVFLRMLRETFAHTRHDSNLLLTQRDLSAVFPDPAMDYIERQGGSVQLGQRVTQIHINHEAITGLTLEDRSIKAQHVILATPYQVTAKLCKSHPDTENLATVLEKFRSNPICTVYLQYPHTIALSNDMLGMVGTLSQWVFDRKIYGQPGLMAVVISGPGEHMSLDNNQLVQRVQTELANIFTYWPEPHQAMVIREKRATFQCPVDINKIRPGNKTSIHGLWIAGDYTDTGLPATLEGAVRSGLRAARGVLKSLRQNN
jgi:squalene-associated FAD-dependent desaturase